MKQVVLSALAVVIGAAAGLAAMGFRYFIDLVQEFFYGFSGEKVTAGIDLLPWWQILLVPVIGGGIVGLFIKHLLPDGKPQGVPHVIEATALKGGRMSLKTGFFGGRSISFFYRGWGFCRKGGACCFIWGQALALGYQSGYT